MTDLSISIEGISDELLRAYDRSDMDRAKAGRAALDWTFGSNSSAFAVARQGSEIVGVSAYIQSRMKFGVTAGHGLQAVDSFVASEMRGKGLFTQLARAYDGHARQLGTDLVWGFPNDNAASAWFQKLEWHSHGQVPFLIKPLRAGLLLRKLRLPLDFPVSFARDQRLHSTTVIGSWADALWNNFSPSIGCGTIRDQDFLTHRLVKSPQAGDYRIVVDPDSQSAALVATREARKHGGRIAYLMEAMGGRSMREILMSELGRLRNRGVEVVLAWSYPWSPNYRTLRSAGFVPLPERFRPIRIWFGSRPHSAAATSANETRQWYLSYLDSDTV